MGSLVKKAVAAVAITKGVGKIREMRRPQPSLWSRLAPVLGIAALGAGAFYLNKTGKLQPMVEKAKDMTTNTKNTSILDDSLREPSAAATS
ncbi:MAG: hypothetical protein ACRDJ2_01245 [Actinomycetota bacterium]